MIPHCASASAGLLPTPTDSADRTAAPNTAPMLPFIRYASILEPEPS